MKLVKEFLKDRYTLWLMRFTLLMGLFLAAFSNIVGYFFLVVFVGWYIAVIATDNHFPVTDKKGNLSKVYTTHKPVLRPERVEIITSTEEIDPLFEEDMIIPFLECVG